MVDFIIDDGVDLYLNKEFNDLYINKVKKEEIDNLFKHPLEIINSEEDISLIDLIECGGIKESKKLTKPPSAYLKILPTFINVVKGRIIYQGKTKLSLEKIHPVNKKDPIILGTIIELTKLKKVLEKESITKKDIVTFINNYDIVPLLYNNEDNKDKEIIFKNKKKNFFSKDAKLCLVTFELIGINSFYSEVPSKEVKINFEKIEDVVKDKNYIVSHYIYNNFLFLVPPHNLKLFGCYLINIGSDQNSVEIKETKDFKYEPNNRKIQLSEIDNIVSKIRPYLSSFK